MAKLLMKVSGLDGDVELLNDRVVINRPGIWNALKFGLNAKREIPLSGISEIGFKNANIVMMGEIDFIVGGGPMTFGKKKKASLTAVKFKKKNQKEFEALKEKVFEQMSQQHRQQKM